MKRGTSKTNTGLQHYKGIVKRDTQEIIKIIETCYKKLYMIKSNTFDI